MAAANFSYYDGSSYRALVDQHGMACTYEPSKLEMLVRGASYVERANDNAGTFVLNSDGYEIGYVPNSQHTDIEDGDVWLYYSADVKIWLGLPE